MYYATIMLGDYSKRGRKNNMAAKKEISKDEFDTMMSHGYADALAGRHEDVDKVFDELDAKIDARSDP